MAQSKAKLLEQLAALNVEVSPEATAADLARLLKRVKAIREGSVVAAPAGRRAAPLAARPAARPQVASEALTTERLPDPGSDHGRRPYDPYSGWPGRGGY